MKIEKIYEEYKLTNTHLTNEDKPLYLELNIDDENITEFSLYGPTNNVSMTMQEYNILTAVLNHIIRDKVESKNPLTEIDEIENKMENDMYE